MTMKNKEIEEKMNEVIEKMTDKELIMNALIMLIHADLMTSIKGESSDDIDNQILEIIDRIDMIEKTLYENYQMTEVKKELKNLSNFIDQVNAKVESMRIERLMKENKEFNWGTKPVFEKR